MDSLTATGVVQPERVMLQSVEETVPVTGEPTIAAPMIVPLLLVLSLSPGNPVLGHVRQVGKISFRMLRSLFSRQRRAHEVGNMLDGFLAFGKQRLVGLEHMEHPRPELELHLDSVRSSLLRQPNAVVSEHLVLANLTK